LNNIHLVKRLENHESRWEQIHLRAQMEQSRSNYLEAYPLPRLTLISVYMILCHKYLIVRGTSWSWSYGSWIYTYLCNQCLSPFNCSWEV